MKRRILRVCGGLLLAHLAASAGFLLLLAAIPSGSFSIAGLAKAPLVALIMTPFGALVALPFVLPVAAILTMALLRRSVASRAGFAGTGALCGAVSVALMTGVLPGLFDPAEVPLALAAAAAAGAAGGLVLRPFALPERDAVRGGPWPGPEPGG